MNVRTIRIRNGISKFLLTFTILTTASFFEEQLAMRHIRAWKSIQAYTKQRSEVYTSIKSISSPIAFQNLMSLILDSRLMRGT